MSSLEYNSLSELLPIRKYNWKIKAKVSRKWVEKNPLNGYANGFNVILVDEYVSSTFSVSFICQLNINHCTYE